MTVSSFFVPLILSIRDLNDSGINRWLITYVQTLIIIDNDLIP